MEENKMVNEQIENGSHATEVEKDNAGELTKDISLGKFKDVTSLLNAYNSLESEFTKRCQKVKELEGIIEAKDKQTAPLPESGSMPEKVTDEMKTDIIKQYLSEVLGSKQRAMVMADGGVSVITPAAKPKTIAEAGEMAKKLLTK